VAKAGGSGRRITIVAARWNEYVTERLVEGAVEELTALGIPGPEIVHVPGSWEIPVAAKRLLDRDPKTRPDGLIALGCILQGETAHAALLGADVSRALMSLQCSTGVPIAWGVLTPETVQQALDRAGLKHGNKGREAARALIETLEVLETL